MGSPTEKKQKQKANIHLLPLLPLPPPNTHFLLFKIPKLHLLNYNLMLPNHK